jgi:hypothetical protein
VTICTAQQISRIEFDVTVYINVADCACSRPSEAIDVRRDCDIASFAGEEPWDLLTRLSGKSDAAFISLSDVS